MSVRVSDCTEFSAACRSLAELNYLVIVLAPWYYDEDGEIYLDRLWERDLAMHLEYLPRLTVLAPSAPVPHAAGDLVRLPSHMVDRVSFLDLPKLVGRWHALLHLPSFVGAIARAVTRADIVQSGAAGSPIPPGLIANTMAVATRKHLVMVIESSPWRVFGAKTSFHARIRAAVVEAFCKWSVRRAALAIYTHHAYAKEYPISSGSRALVTPAIWIDDEHVVSQSDASALWSAKPLERRYLLASRLVPAKGIAVAMDALRLADRQGIDLYLDVIGEGPAEEELIALQAELKTARLRLLRPVPYGEPFFRVLREYHGVVVPSLTDEQPRIIYDAFAQALPVIASDTVGHREAVRSGETGVLVTIGDASALLTAMREPTTATLKRWGLNARAWVYGRSHREMHRQRARVLADLFGTREALVPDPSPNAVGECR